MEEEKTDQPTKRARSQPGIIYGSLVLGVLLVIGLFVWSGQFPSLENAKTPATSIGASIAVLTPTDTPVPIVTVTNPPEPATPTSIPTNANAAATATSVPRVAVSTAAETAGLTHPYPSTGTTAC